MSMGRMGSGVEMGSGGEVEEVEAASRGVEAITDSALRRGLVAFIPSVLPAARRPSYAYTVLWASAGMARTGSRATAAV